MAYRLFLGSSPPAEAICYPDEVAADSPSAVFPMGEASGNIVDLVAGLTGTTGGSPTYGQTGLVTGYTSIDFDADADAFSVTDHANLDLGGTAFTIEAWIQSDADLGAVYQTAVDKGANAYQIGINPDNHYFLAKNGVAIAGLETGSISLDNAMHHVVWTFAAGGSPCTLYVDGSSVALSTNTDPTFADNSTALLIGDGHADSHISGKVQWVALYKSTLSGSRVAAHFNAVSVECATTEQDITLGLLDASPALYAPTVTPKNTVTLGLLDASPALYAPTLLTKNTITLGLLDASAALYAPTLAPQPVTITLGSIDASNALYAPNISSDAALPLLDAANALYPPTLGATYALTPPLLDAGPALYAPNISFTIDAPFIDAANALYAPSLTVGPVTVTLGLLDASSALYAPSIAVTLDVPFLDAGPELYAPDLIQDQFVTLGLLDAGPELYEPAFSGAGTIVLQLLDAANDLYAPQLTPQPVSITLGLLTSTSALYAPAIAVIGGNQSVTLPTLTSARGLFAPVLSGPDTNLPEYEAIRLYRTPARRSVTLPVLASRASLYAPTVAVDDDAEIFAMLAYA